jgi:hypothetical protein
VATVDVSTVEAVGRADAAAPPSFVLQARIEE